MLNIIFFAQGVADYQ